MWQLKCLMSFLIDFYLFLWKKKYWLQPHPLFPYVSISLSLHYFSIFRSSCQNTSEPTKYAGKTQQKSRAERSLRFGASNPTKKILSATNVTSNKDSHNECHLFRAEKEKGPIFLSFFSQIIKHVYNTSNSSNI